MKSKEEKILEKLQTIATNMDLYMRVDKYKNRNAYRVRFATGKDERNCNLKNVFTQLLHRLNLINNKHINSNLLFQRISVRKAIVTGFVDGDGHFSKNQCEIVQSLEHEDLITGLCRMIQSLGFFARMYGKTATYTHKGVKKQKEQIRLCFNGKMNDLPICTDKKKGKNAKKNINLLPFEIECMGNGEFVGFELDKDQKFLLSNFVVAHNCPGLFTLSLFNITIH